MDGRDDVDSQAFLRRCPELAQHRGGALERRCVVGALLARRLLVWPPQR